MAFPIEVVVESLQQSVHIFNLCIVGYNIDDFTHVLAELRVDGKVQLEQAIVEFLPFLRRRQWRYRQHWASDILKVLS